MRKKQKKIQITLISIGLILILATYFYYPYIKKVEYAKNVQDKEKILDVSESEQETLLENVEYKGLYDLDKPFTVNSEKAVIFKNEPNVVYMTKMHVILYLKDGRVVNIVSDKGRYNKKTYDCFFEEHVIATEGETKIIAQNLDLLATESSMKAYNNVSIDHPTANLKADIIDYDFESKYFKVSMYNENKIKMKLIK